MPVAKDKVMAAIEQKFKGKSLTKTFKDDLATKWAEKIESEDGIGDYVNDREDVILAASAEADRRATAASEKTKREAAEAVTGKPKPETETENVEVPSDMPEWMKPIMTQMQTLSSTVAGMQKEKQVQSLTERFKEDPRVKGIPEAMLKGYIPRSEDQFEAAAEEVKTVLGPLASQLTASEFASPVPVAPHNAAGGGSKTKEASPAEVDALLSNMRL